jgi:putative transposase
MLAPTRELKPTQTCSGCGKVKKKELGERKHECECGLKISWDRNAARVILKWAIAQISKETGQELAESV